MKTTVKKIGDSKIVLTVEVPETDVNQLLNEAAKSLSQRINIPGFRQGSAPRSVVEAKVGPEAIADEFVQSGGLAIIYGRAISEIGQEPIAPPELEIKQAMETGKPFKFEATVEVRPDVDLTGIKKIKVEKEKVSVTEDDLKREIDELRNRFAEVKEAEDKKIKNGLFAVLDYEATVEGKPLEGGQATDYLLEIGSNNFWPGFEKQLIGAEPDEEREISVKVPENYFEKSMAGKTAKFKVKIKELKKKVVPKVDKEFAKKVGFESVEGFKKDIKDNIKRVKENQAQETFGGEVIKAATEAAKVSVPQTMVDQYTDRMMSTFVRQLNEVGASLEDYLSTQEHGMTVEMFKERVAKDATITAKSDLVLEALAMQEKISVTDKELDSALERYINSIGDEASHFTSGPDALTNRTRLRMAIKKDLIKAKAADFLVKKVEKSAVSKKPAKATKPTTAGKSATKGKTAPKRKPATAGKTAKEDKS